MIVDDERAIRQFLEEFLTLQGYHVDTASNGFDGLRLFDHGNHCLVIVDYMMPDINGIDFIDKIRGKNDSVQIIGMSAVDARDLFLKAGANRFFKKPFSLQILKNEVDLLMQNCKEII